MLQTDKNINYIQEDRLNFLLAYYTKNNEIIFINNLNKIENKKFIDLEYEYPIIVIPTNFLNYSDFTKKFFSDKINKYQDVIFIESQRSKELDLIFL